MRLTVPLRDSHQQTSLSFRRLLICTCGALRSVLSNAPPCLYFYGAFIYSSGTLTPLLSNIQPCSCFSREPWHTAMELLLLSAFLCSTMFMFLQRFVIHFCTAVTFLLSSFQPCSSIHFLYLNVKPCLLLIPHSCSNTLTERLGTKLSSIFCLHITQT